MKKVMTQEQMVKLFKAIKKYQRDYSKRPEVRKRRAAYEKAKYHALRAAYLASLKK